MTHRRRRAAATASSVAAGALLAGATLTGCGSAVEVAAPAGARDPACAKVAWPATVSGQERRGTTSDSPAVAAWGDPAIVARCGVATPDPTTDECVAVDDVDWVVHPVQGGAVLTTYGRTPAVEVLVPTQYGAAPLLLPSFTAAARAVPQGEHHCS